MKREQAKLGECVRLSSGGPTMTIVREPDNTNPDTCGCAWFDGKKQERDAFPTAGLEVVARMVMP